MFTERLQVFTDIRDSAGPYLNFAVAKVLSNLEDTIESTFSARLDPRTCGNRKSATSKWQWRSLEFYPDNIRSSRSRLFVCNTHARLVCRVYLLLPGKAGRTAFIQPGNRILSSDSPPCSPLEEWLQGTN